MEEILLLKAGAIVEERSVHLTRGGKVRDKNLLLTPGAKVQDKSLLLVHGVQQLNSLLGINGGKKIAKRRKKKILGVSQIAVQVEASAQTHLQQAAVGVSQSNQNLKLGMMTPGGLPRPTFLSKRVGTTLILIRRMTGTTTENNRNREEEPS